MENDLELMDTHKSPEAVVAEETINVEELKRRAEVSSQNFERAKKAENELKELRAKLLDKPNTPVEIPEEAMSDEGKALKEKISALERTLNTFQEKASLSTVFSQYPALKDKQAEFEEFRSEYPGMALDKLAKVFVIENGLATPPAPKRVGLEKPTGGPKNTPKPQGMSIEDVQRIRTSQPKLYQKMLKDGRINPDSIE